MQNDIHQFSDLPGATWLLLPQLRNDRGRTEDGPYIVIQPNSPLSTLIESLSAEYGIDSILFTLKLSDGVWVSHVNTKEIRRAQTRQEITYFLVNEFLTLRPIIQDACGMRATHGHFRAARLSALRDARAKSLKLAE